MKSYDDFLKNGTSQEAQPIQLVSFNMPLQCDWNNHEVKTWLYCGGNIIILFGSFINSLLLIIILIQHLRSKKQRDWGTYVKVKPCILYLMIIFEVAVFIRYLFHFNSGDMGVYNALLVGQQSLESIIFFLICYFFTKKASHFLTENKKIR